MCLPLEQLQEDALHPPAEVPAYIGMRLPRKLCAVQYCSRFAAAL